jgi:phosphomannomutase
MRKLIVGLALAGATVLGAYATPAQAKSAGGVALDGVVAFSASANYMSIPGYVRYRIFQRDGRWISRTEAEQLVRDAQ